MIGTVTHSKRGVAVGIHYDAPMKSTLKTRRYACGLEKPNYPMPAKLDGADIASSYLLLSMCPYTNGPCVICIEKYLDAIEDAFLIE